MRKQRTALIAAICTLVLICVFAGTFFFSSMPFQIDRYKVTLPKELNNTDDLSSNVVEEHPGPDAKLPELTPENVQEVISLLPHLEQYSGSVTNTIYLEEGETSVWRAATYVKNSAQRVERYRAGETLPEIHLYFDDHIYVWEQGSTTYWSSAVGDLTGDMAAMIPSYRDICNIPTEKIAETELVYLNGVPHIRVISDLNEAEYLVSVITGLLEQVKYFENGELVREIVITSSEEEPADQLFILPGTSDPIFAPRT